MRLAEICLKLSFPDENLDRKFEKRSNRNSVEKGLDEEIAAMKSVIHEDDNKSQDSLAEYEKIISEKLEFKIEKRN